MAGYVQEITSEIVQELCVLEERGAWNLEFNVVKWNGDEPKYDIRHGTAITVVVAKGSHCRKNH